MSVSYDVFAGAFLGKINEYSFLRLDIDDRTTIVDGLMKRALSQFKKNCKYDLFSTANDDMREFDVEIEAQDLEEIADIVSEGMVVQWLKPYLYQQENLQNVLNTKDISTYSPAELLTRIGSVHLQSQKHYTQMIREYSYNHGDLSSLHL